MSLNLPGDGAPEAEFEPRAMHRIECMRCGAEWDADARDVRSWQRDGPHEISIEMECPSCRVEGVLHIHGGPQVPEEHAVVLHTLLDK